MIGRRLLVALWVAVLGSLGAAQLTYPVTATVETIEELHDEKVADPYRWLEDDVRTSPAVAEWVAAQNATTFAYLGSIAERDAVKARLKELWNYERVLMPTKAGKRYAFQRNDGLQNQNVLYVADAIDAAPRVLLDPNTWTKDGTVSLAGMSFSKAGRYLAYAVAEAGSDWRTWRVPAARSAAQPMSMFTSSGRLRPGNESTSRWDFPPEAASTRTWRCLTPRVGSSSTATTGCRPCTLTTHT